MEPSPYEETLSKIEVLTKEAASNGAKIVAFQETAIKVIEKDENTFIEQCKNRVILMKGFAGMPFQLWAGPWPGWLTRTWKKPG